MLQAAHHGSLVMEIFVTGSIRPEEKMRLEDWQDRGLYNIEAIRLAMIKLEGAAR